MLPFGGDGSLKYYLGLWEKNIMKAGRRKLSHIVYLLPVILITFLPFCANATTIDFYTDGTIQSGNSYDKVKIWNTATVDMTGGSAESVWTYDSSCFNIQNGNVSLVVSSQNTSTIKIYGGSIGSLQLVDYSVVHIFGGSISGSLGVMVDTAIAHIYATNFTVAPKNGYPSNGWLITGNWDDATNTPFTIWSRNNTLPMPGTAGSQVILHIVPEPITLSFLLIGLVGIKKNRG
jgi:hypothetical protein